MPATRLRTQRRFLRAPAAVLTIVVIAAALAGCGSGGGERITVYSGRNAELIGPLLERFARRTGISVDVRYGESADLALLLGEERDRSPADVFISQSPGAMGYVDGRRLLRRLPDRILDRVPARFRARDGDWVGLSGRVRVLVYNRDRLTVSQLPVSVLDLTDPRWRGRVGIAPTNASFQDFVTALRTLIGEDRTRRWLEGLRANDVRTYANNVAIVEAVGRGEVDLGLVNHYYNERAKAENPGVRSENHLFPAGDPGTLILVTAAGVLRTASNPAAAERLVAFLLSRGAQEFFAAETFEYPLAAGVDPAVEDLPPLADIAAPDVAFDALGDELARTRRLIRRAGLEG